MSLEDLIHGGDSEIPKDIATCPECGGKLSVDCWEWNSETGVPSQFGFNVSCDAEDEALEDWTWNEDDNRRFTDVAHGHRQSDWQPVIDAVWDWIKTLEGSVKS
jgi:hypothetical protein